MQTGYLRVCAVDQKLSYFYMFSFICMLGVKACMHVAYVFQELNIHWHSIKRLIFSAKTSRNVGMVLPFK